MNGSARHKGTLMMVSLLGAWGCDREPAPAPRSSQERSAVESPLAPPKTDMNDAQQAALGRAQQRAGAFATQLKAKLLGALQQGPATAVTVCATEAQRMTEDAQGDDVALGRASLRMRNPETRVPGWVQAQLDAWGERKAAGLAPVVLPSERDVRLVMPIAVDGCV